MRINKFALNKVGEVDISMNKGITATGSKSKLQSAEFANVVWSW